MPTRGGPRSGMLLFIEIREDLCTEHDDARGHPEATSLDPIHVREAERCRFLLLPGVASTGRACLFLLNLKGLIPTFGE